MLDDGCRGQGMSQVAVAHSRAQASADSGVGVLVHAKAMTTPKKGMTRQGAHNRDMALPRVVADLAESARIVGLGPYHQGWRHGFYDSRSVLSDGGRSGVATPSLAADSAGFGEVPWPISRSSGDRADSRAKCRVSVVRSTVSCRYLW